MQQKTKSGKNINLHTHHVNEKYDEFRLNFYYYVKHKQQQKIYVRKSYETWLFLKKIPS